MQNSTRIKAKLSSKNQLTIPKVIRDSLGLSNQDEVIFQIDNGTVILKKGNDFWNEVKQQEKVYGNLSTGQLDWDSDMGEEVIFD